MLALTNTLRLSFVAIVISLLVTPAIASKTNYDGQWILQVSCPATSTAAALLIKENLDVRQGSSKFTAQLRTGVAQGSVLISRNRTDVKLSGPASLLSVVPVRADGSFGEWKLDLRGAVKGDSDFTAEGDEYQNGDFLRSCTATASLLKASPYSLASLNNAIKSTEQTSTGAGSPTKTSQSSSKPAPPPADGFHSDWVSPMPTRLSADVETIRQGDAQATQALGQTQPPPPAKPNTGFNPQVDSDNRLSAQEVRTIQAGLKSVGFYDGAVDGVSGPRTRAAIEIWQRQKGLKPTGQLTAQQIKQLSEAATLAAAAKVDPGPLKETATAAPMTEPAKDPDQSSVQNPVVAESAPIIETKVLSSQEILEQKLTSRVGPVTAKNLSNGDDGDILLFTNESPEAPHFIRRVTGEGAFRDNKMNVCAVGNLRGIDPVYGRYASDSLNKIDTEVVVHKSPPWDTSCKSLTDNTTNDVIAVLRSDVAKDPILQNQILSAIANKKFRWFDVIARGPFDASIKQQEELGKVLRDQLKDGSLTGYGLLASDSKDLIVCADKTSDSEFVKQALADIGSSILKGKSPGSNLTVKRSELDDVFLQTKRGECGFIFGNGTTLTLLNTAFERDGFALELIPAMVSEDRAQAMLEKIKEAAKNNAPVVSKASNSALNLPTSRSTTATESQLTEATRNQSVQITPQQMPESTSGEFSTDRLTRQDTQSIQAALKALGIYDGAVDGVGGPRTKTAIGAWQKQKGLQVSGQLNENQFIELTQATSNEPNAIKSLAASPTKAINVPPAKSEVAPAQVILEQQLAARVGPITAKNLSIGNDGDILLFTNESPEAPHFIRRVTGEGAFRGNKMNVCAVGNLPSVDPVFGQYTSSALEKMDTAIAVQNTPPWATICKSVSKNNTSDIIAVLRSDIAKNPALQNQILSAIADKKVRWYGAIDRRPFDALIDQEEDRGKILRTQLKDGTLTGFGLLTSESKDLVICTSRSSDTEFVKRAVAEINSLILKGKKPDPDAAIKKAELDDVFLQTKRGECRFIFGSGAMLTLLNTALERDGFSVDLISATVSDDRAQAMLEGIQKERAETAVRITTLQAQKARLAEQAEREAAEKQAAALRKAQERQAALEQQKKLEAARVANDEAMRREKLEQIRRVVASRGRAIQDVLDTRIRQHLSNVSQEVSDTKLRVKLGQMLSPREQAILKAENELKRLSTTFPVWSGQTVKLAKEEWSFSDISASLEDYGQATWRGREIEAISVRVEFPMSNAIIGERRTDCMVFTWINDDEFKFWRQTMETDCTSYPKLFDDWAIKNQFNSQWKLTNR